MEAAVAVRRSGARPTLLRRPATSPGCRRGELLRHREAAGQPATADSVLAGTAWLAASTVASGIRSTWSAGTTCGTATPCARRRSSIGSSPNPTDREGNVVGKFLILPALRPTCSETARARTQTRDHPEDLRTSAALWPRHWVPRGVCATHTVGACVALGVLNTHPGSCSRLVRFIVGCWRVAG
jgi:hypothetical protein